MSRPTRSTKRITMDANDFVKQSGLDSLCVLAKERDSVVVWSQRSGFRLMATCEVLGRLEKQ